MTDITHTVRLARGQQVELNEAELIELRDALNRLYPPPSVLAPLVAPLPHPPAPMWPPTWGDPHSGTLTGDPVPSFPVITCGGDSAAAA